MKTIFIIAVIVLSTISRTTIDMTQPNFKTIAHEGMSVKWRIVTDTLQCVMQAPTNGWVAIGFNSRNELKGTNLLMGAVKNGKCIMDDRYIVAVGDHRSVKDLGGFCAVTNISAAEERELTWISFSIPLQVNDGFHQKLNEGNTYYLLMAYSTEDDFTHHSRMRISVKIKL